MKNFKEIENGNIFDSKCDIITNPVNCIGIMGAGLAKQFAIRFPRIKEEYRIACRLKDISIGHPSYHAIGENDDSRIVCNFPTMYYPGSITKKEDIELGLLQLCKDLTFPDSVIYNKSIAFCALGCGIGRFSYNELKKLIFTIFEEYDNLIELYKPINL